jgi:molybdopterin-guanine dinucleotide biosynthesis protein A
MTDRADMAAIFAGGEGRRMCGVDKGALLFGGQPLWRVVADRLAPQARGLCVLSSIAPPWVGRIEGAIWIADAPGGKGPSAGLLSALTRLEKEQGPEALLLTAPVDAPFLPEDLFAILEETMLRASAPAAIARHAGGLHPVFGLWRAGCADAVARAMEENRALHRIAARAGAVDCEGWTGRTPDPFANLNTPEDVAAAEEFLGRA